MKLLVLLLLCLIPFQWEPDFTTAKKAAAEQHKLILLNFSGSDWCGPCLMMRRDYFESAVFTKVANENLIMVNADFPRKTKNVTAEQTKRNEALAEQYNKNGIFPLTLLLDSEGKVLQSWHGKPNMPVEKWVDEIQAVCDANK